MTHGSLFSGMGGFDLAAEWMGWENIFHCEWKPFNQKILKYYWPNAISYSDITKTDFSIHRGTIDIVTGGFPCQPYSVAGKRKGKEDDRHLWPEMLRAIREIQPKFIVGENVPGIVSWSEGLVFEQVQAEMEAEGYEVQTVLLPACAVNAPHKRDRIWFVAYSESNGDRGGLFNMEGKNDSEWQSKKYGENYSRVGNDGTERNATNTNPQGLQEWISTGIGSIQSQAGQPQGSEFTRTHSAGNWQEFPTVSPVCERNDGLPERLDGITFSKWRTESIMSGGNAIVPQVALQIFKAIQQYQILNP